jgi:hypothetical protein
MAFNFTERRANTRTAYFHLIKYVLDPDFPNKIFRGCTINISSSGLRLYIYDLLNKGQEIFIISSLSSSPPGPKGTVRWVKKLHDNTYEIGLEFT